MSIDGTDNEKAQEMEYSIPIKKNLGNEAKGEQILKEISKEGGKQEDHILSGPERSLIKVLVSLKLIQRQIKSKRTI